MRAFRDTLATLCLAALLLLLLALLLFWWKNKDVVHDTLRDTHQTILEIGLTAKNLREASLQWKQASGQQVMETTKAMQSVTAAAGKLSAFISDTNSSMNGSLIPSLTSSVREQNASLLESEKALHANLTDMGKATQQLQKTLADADTRITDPAIQKTMDSVAESGAHLASITEHVDKTTAKVEQGVTYEVDQLMKPVKKVKVALEFLATIAGKFLGL